MLHNLIMKGENVSYITMCLHFPYNEEGDGYIIDNIACFFSKRLHFPIE